MGQRLQYQHSDILTAKNGLNNSKELPPGNLEPFTQLICKLDQSFWRRDWNSVSRPNKKVLEVIYGISSGNIWDRIGKVLIQTHISQTKIGHLSGSLQRSLPKRVG
jgi:hypothetical protein